MSNIPIYDSAQRPPPMLDELLQILKYRDLVGQLVRRDIVTRYKRSALGVTWTMLYPLGTMLVLTIAFSQVFGATRAYSAYLLSGLIAWNFFSQTTVHAMRQLVWGGGLLRRIYLPKTVFAVSAIGTGLVNLLLALVPLTIVTVVNGLVPQPTIFFLPISILLMATFALGIGLVFSTIAVFFPDVAEMYEIALTAWMYLTPIIYPEEIIQEPIRSVLFTLNPMYHLIKLFRLPLYNQRLPTLEEFVLAAAIAITTLGIGWFVFTRKSDEFAYRV